MQRLKTRSQFQAVLAGHRVASTSHFVLHRCEPGHSDRPNPFGWAVPTHVETIASIQDSWIGAMVPKRWAKRAVTRNLIRRQIYSVSSELVFSGPVAAHVIRLRAAFDRGVFVSASSSALGRLVRQQLRQLFAQASLRATASPPRVNRTQ